MKAVNDVKSNFLMCRLNGIWNLQLLEFWKKWRCLLAKKYEFHQTKVSRDQRPKLYCIKFIVDDIKTIIKIGLVWRHENFETVIRIGAEMEICTKLELFRMEIYKYFFRCYKIWENFLRITEISPQFTVETVKI